MLDLKESLMGKINRLLKARKKPLFDQPLPFPQNENINRFVWVLIVFVIFFVLAAGIFFERKLWSLSQKQKSIHRLAKKLKSRVLDAPYYLDKIPAPRKFSLVPFGEKTGLVVGVKEVKIRGVTAPYNASLIRSAFGYDLFFRYDVISSKAKAKNSLFFSRVGVVHLNSQFEQEDKEFKRIDLQTEYAEDPRVVLVNDQLYLFYNANNKSTRNRSMCVAHLDKESFKVSYSTVLDVNLQWVEKNWSPFEYTDINQKPQFFLEYQIMPRKLFELSDPCTGEMKPLTLPQEVAYLSLLWSSEWGTIRGGAPAQKIGDEYLGFFHSSFKDHDLIWYVMGAYTFEAHPPFRITGISHYPILFRGIFDTPYMNTASLDKRVIFPSGFVLEKQKDQELIHVACGENDSAVKVITLDKEKLLESMNRFEY